jgi:peptide/nickel transport system ATP-binding protein
VSFHRDGADLPALRGVSFDIRQGEILGLVGESGSGKTVLGLSLLGLLRAHPMPRTEGLVRVLGVDMLDAPEAERRALRRSSLGAIFQDPMTSLDPTMRIGKQLHLVTGSDGESVALLDSVGIPDARARLKSFPHELSGGQRQRVMIAMAIAGDPALVLADEPTTALDVTVQAQVLQLIKELRDRIKCTFVFVTHDLSVAAQVADRIAVLYGGRLVEIGEVSDVLNKPLHPYTIGLLNSRLSLTADRSRPLKTLAGGPPDLRRLPTGCPFAPRCSLAIDACNEALPELVHGEHGRSLAACIRLDVSANLSHEAKLLDPWPISTEVEATPQLSVRGLEKTFHLSTGVFSRRDVFALRGVDLDVLPGECVAVVGESGCGKSTLLRVIGGLIKPDHGEITTGGGASPQMVFQDAGASLTPWLAVRELIEERLRNVGQGGPGLARRVSDVLQLVGLNDEIGLARPGQLSGGQRQRVAIARAVAVPPSVLLCDEPTSALDVSLAAMMLNLLSRLRRELDLAVLFVTHDLAAARVVADRVAVMYLGKVVEIGQVDRVVEHPEHPYTKALLASVPGRTRDAKPIVQGDPASPTRIPVGCPFHPRCPDAIAECREVVPELRELSSSEGRFVSCIRAGVDI